MDKNWAKTEVEGSYRIDGQVVFARATQVPMRLIPVKDSPINDRVKEFLNRNETGRRREQSWLRMQNAPAT